MKVFVLLFGLSFVAVGIFLVSCGRDPITGWQTILLFGGVAAVAAADLIQPNFQRSTEELLEEEDFARRLVRRTNKAEVLANFLGSSGFAAAGALMIWTGKAPVLGWVTLNFFGLGSALFAWQLLDGRPRLVIDAEGIFDRTLGVGRISWSDVERAYVRSLEGQDFLCLVVHDPQAYLGKLSPLRRKLTAANLALGLTEFSVNLSELSVSTDELGRLLTCPLLTDQEGWESFKGGASEARQRGVSGVESS